MRTTAFADPFDGPPPGVLADLDPLQRASFTSLSKPGGGEVDPFDGPPPEALSRPDMPGARPAAPGAQLTWRGVGQDVIDSAQATIAGAADLGKYIVSAPDAHRGLIGDLLGGLMAGGGGVYGAARGGVENINELLPGKPMQGAVDWLGRQAQIAQRNAAAASPPVQPDDPALVRAGVGAVQSIGQQLPGLAATIATGGSVAPMLIGMGVATGGQGYQQAREAGVSPLASLGYGVGVGGIEGLTEMTPALSFLGNLRMGSPLSKTLRDLLAHEMAGEQAATLTQDASEQAVLHPEKTWGQFLAERPQAALDTALQVVIQSGLMAGAGHAVQRAGVREAAGSNDPAMRAEAAAHGSDRPEDVLAAALSGQPEAHGLAAVLSQDRGGVLHGAPSGYAAPFTPEQSAPASSTATGGGNLDGALGLESGVRPTSAPPSIDIDTGAPYRPAAQDDMRALHRMPIEVEAARQGERHSPANGQTADESQDPFDAPPPPEAPDARVQAVAEEDPFNGPPPTVESGTHAEHEGDDYAGPVRTGTSRSGHDQAVYGGMAPGRDGSMSHPMELTVLRNDDGQIVRFGTHEPGEGKPATWHEASDQGMEDMHDFDVLDWYRRQRVFEASKAPTARLRPGTPEYVRRLERGFQPRASQRDINAYKADIRRGAAFGSDNPILRMLESNPLDVKEAADYGADFGRVKGARINRSGRKIAGTTGTGQQRYFSEGGMSIDTLTERLWEQGFITREQMNDQRVMHDIVRQTLEAGPKGAGPQPVHSQGYMEDRGKIERAADEAAYHLDEMERTDLAMLEAIHELADADPDAFDPMIRALADNSDDEDAAVQAVRRLYNQYVTGQRSTVGAGDGGAAAAGEEAQGAGAGQRPDRGGGEAGPEGPQGPQPGGAEAVDPFDAPPPREGDGGPASGMDDASALSTYTPEDIEQREWQRQQAQADEREAEQQSRRRAQAESEADDFTLTGSDREADQAAARGQKPLFDRVPKPVRGEPLEGENAPQDLGDADTQARRALAVHESRTPPGGIGKDFESQAFTQRPSRFVSAWGAMGLTPAQGANLPIDQAIRKLARLYQDHFGLKVEVDARALRVETRDSLLDGYNNIQDMMFRLGLPTNAAGLNGTLTLRMEPFKGKYLGAYDPGARTIHMPGRSNSFGHEWMHALDHYLTTIAQRGLPEGTANNDLFSFVVDREGAVKPADRLQGAFASLLLHLYGDKADLAWQALQLQVAAAQLNPKTGKPTVAAQEAQAKLDKLLAGKKVSRLGDYGIEPSDYRKSVTAMGNDAYWGNPAEMLARAFEAYLASQRPRGLLNEFVSKTEEAYLSNADDRLRDSFPKDGDRFQIFNAFDGFFDALRETNELGDGEAAQMPADQGYLDPSRWGRYPNNDRTWQQTVAKAVGQFRGMRVPSMAQLQAKASATPAALNTFVHQLWFGQREHLKLLESRYKGAAPLRQIRQMLFAERESGEFSAANWTEAVTMRSHRRVNELMRIMDRAGLKALTDKENRFLRMLLVGAQDMTHEQAREALDEMGLEDIDPKRMDALAGIAPDLRRMMDQEWYYNTRNGIELGYTRNGFMPRVMDHEKVYGDPDGFEKTAARMYGVVFDQDVGTSVAELDAEGFRQAASDLRAAARNEALHEALAPRDETLGAIDAVARLQRQIRGVEQAMRKSDDPDQLQAKLDELHDKLTDAIEEALPLMREDWARLAAGNWRSRLVVGDAADFDRIGPDSKYTRGRTLPPEADVIMADYYIQDTVDAIATYMERSTRRVEYARRFGAGSEKLQKMLNTLERDHGMHREDLDWVRSIVNNVTGRENHPVTSTLKDGLNAMSSWMTLYMLGRSTFASTLEMVAAGGRTGRVRDFFTPFLHQFKDVFSKASREEMAAMAELAGLYTVPHMDALMINRIAGDSLTRNQSLRAARFFENIGLGPLTRSQRRSLIAVTTGYLRYLAQRAEQDHAPSLASLHELGIRPDAVKGFARWLLHDVQGMPTPQQLIDPYTDEFHTYGQMLMTAIRRFSSETVVEGQKIDMPRTATNPVARFAWGIMRFNYAAWYNVTKPLLKRLGADVNTLVRGSDPTTNRGRTRLEAAADMTTAATALGMILSSNLLTSILRALLFSRDAWDDHEKKGDLWAWLWETAFWRSGFAGLADPLVQAFRAIRWQRDLTTLTAGAQMGQMLQNLQDIAAVFSATNSPNTNTAERKAAKAVWNLAFGPSITWAASFTPAGAIWGTLAGMGSMYAGSADMQNRFADLTVGPDEAKAKRDARAQRLAENPGLAFQEEVRAERRRRRAEEQAARAAP